METILKSEVLKYISDTVYNKIIDEKIKCIGIQSLSEKENRNKKRVGRIIMIHYNNDVPANKRKKTLLLGNVVEYKRDNINWQSSNTNGKSGFHLVDPYYVRPYTIDAKLSVPIQVFKPKTNTLETEMVSYTYRQFQERRLEEYFINREWPYKAVRSYHNFRKVFASTGQYYMGINSTVKHCMINQGALLKIIGVVDAHKKKIKNEWTKYMQAELNKKQLTCDLELSSVVVEEGVSSHENVVKFRSS